MNMNMNMNMNNYDPNEHLQKVAKKQTGSNRSELRMMRDELKLKRGKSPDII